MSEVKESHVILGTLVESVSDHFEPHAGSLLTLCFENDGGGGEVDHLFQANDVEVGGGFSGDGSGEPHVDVFVNLLSVDVPGSKPQLQVSESGVFGFSVRDRNGVGRTHASFPGRCVVCRCS